MQAAVFAATAAAAASMGQVMQPAVAAGQHQQQQQQQRPGLEYSSAEGVASSSSSAYPAFSEALPTTSHSGNRSYATPMDESSGPVVATPSTSEPTQ